jgi:segregation and condensation protein B
VDEAQPEAADHLVALLFVASEPIAAQTAARVLGVSLESVNAIADWLDRRPLPGLRLQRHDDALQLTTAPSSTPFVRRLLGVPEVSRLSRAALEVLAVVTYRQPVTRAEIDELRGVSSDRALATLMSRGLVEEVGHRDTPGRPGLLGTGFGLLQYLGLASLGELPRFPEEAEDDSH